MKLYYQNETLYIDLNLRLDKEKARFLKRRIFRIVDDYDIDHIVLRSFSNDLEYRKMLEEIKREYQQKYCGYFCIK